MFKSLRTYKKLKLERDTLAQELQKLQKTHNNTKEQLSNSESLNKGLQQQIRTLTNDLQKLQNTTNAYLSTLINIKRHLENLFNHDSNPAPIPQNEKTTIKPPPTNFKNPKQTTNEWNIKPYPFDDTTK